MTGNTVMDGDDAAAMQGGAAAMVTAGPGPATGRGRRRAVTRR